MDKNINQFCDFFDNLPSGLKDSVTNICNQAKNKSTIYTDIINLLHITRKFYLSDNSLPNEEHTEMLGNTWTKSKNKIEMLDTILNEYKVMYPTENINKDLFFLKLFNSCIKDYILYTSQPIFEEKSLEGGKRRKRKSKKNKNKSKNKKSKKRYSRKYR